MHSLTALCQALRSSTTASSQREQQLHAALSLRGLQSKSCKQPQYSGLYKGDPCALTAV